MDHELSESQSLLKRTAAEFFSREFPLDRIRDFRDDRDGSERELWNSIVGLGWLAAPFPEEIGGFPGSFLDAAVLLEEMGRAAAPSPYLHTAIAAGLALAGAERSLAEAIAEGRAVVIPVPGAPQIEALSASGGRVSGTALGVPWTNLATHYLAAANGECMLLDAGSVAAQRLDASGIECTGRVDFASAEGARLPGSAWTEAQLNGAAGAALVMSGLAARALELAVAYSKERIQFGKPIGAFQALQHRMADMFVAKDVGRNLAYKAAGVHGTADFERAARYAKAYWGEAGNFVTRQAIQIHGGVGFTDDHKVQLSFRLNLNLASNYGTASEHRAAISNAILSGV